MNSQIVEFRDFAFESWKKKYGQKPTWGKPEFVCLVKAFKRVGDFRDAKDRWLMFLLESSDFFRGHNPKKFLFDLDRWVAKSEIDPDTLHAAHVYHEKEFLEFVLKIEKTFADQPEEIAPRLSDCIVRCSDGKLRKTRWPGRLFVSR